MNNQVLRTMDTLILSSTNVLQTNIIIASISTRLVLTTLIALFFFISMVLAPWGVAYANNTAVKWHPGHYYAIMSWGKNKPDYLSRVYNELEEIPALRGIQIRYTWAELEVEKGVYDFTEIDQRLAELAALEKRLVILLQLKWFNTETIHVPEYLTKDRFEGGVYSFGSYDSTIPRGYNIKLWNKLVFYRLALLIRELGERYNSHPYFEGIGLTETAFGQPLIALSDDQVNDYYKNLLRANKKLRMHFPNTMTFQFVNFPRRILESFVSELQKTGTAIGGPDIFITDDGLLYNEPDKPNGIYNYYPKLSGIVPLTPSVMPQNYRNTQHDDGGYEPTVSELLSFGRDQLKANYIFWTRDPAYYQNVIELLNLPDQTLDPAGGLNSTCPAVYSYCIK